MTSAEVVDAPAPAKAKPENKTYVVLSPKAPHEVVHKGKYPSASEAFAAAVGKAELGDGSTASYIVVSEKFFKPRTVKVEVERKLVFS